MLKDSKIINFIEVIVPDRKLAVTMVNCETIEPSICFILEVKSANIFIIVAPTLRSVNAVRAIAERLLFNSVVFRLLAKHSCTI